MKYDFLVYIGRFQPPHLAHIEIIKQALNKAEKVIVLIGSANQPRTIKNPWTATEREEMIRASLPREVQDRVIVRAQRDKTYNDQLWATTVQDNVLRCIASVFTADSAKARVGIIGYSKDESSYYLKMFPQWELVDVGSIEDIHATDIRNAYFGGAPGSFELTIGRNLPHAIHDFLTAFMMREQYDQLCREFDFIETYKKSWEAAPYPPTFVTVDAIIVQSGHVLLVRRRAEPGRGTYAMPGGFIGEEERIENAMLRELREETKLKVPEPVLRGSIKANKVYDHPKRSLRGRTITHAFLIELPPGPLPKVKGSDDADKAKWVPLGVFERMEDQMFEDHYAIVSDLLGHL